MIGCRISTSVRSARWPVPATGAVDPIVVAVDARLWFEPAGPVRPGPVGGAGTGRRRLATGGRCDRRRSRRRSRQNAVVAAALHALHAGQTRRPAAAVDAAVGEMNRYAHAYYIHWPTICCVSWKEKEEAGGWETHHFAFVFRIRTCWLVLLYIFATCFQLKKKYTSPWPHSAAAAAIIFISSIIP